MLPGNVDFIGRMYAFGAMLSFTIAHASVIQLRRKPPPVEAPYRVRPNLTHPRRRAGRSSRSSAGSAPALAWLVVVVQDAPTRYAGLGWLAAGLVFYVIYRRRLGIPLTETVRAPLLLGPAIALEYRTILVPIVAGLGVARGDRPRRAARRRARRDDRRAAGDRRPARPAARRRAAASRRTRPTGCSTRRGSPRPAYGVRTIDRVVRARHAGRAIVDEAARRQAEIVVLGAPRGRHRAIFGKTVDYVLKNAPCRVMVAAGKTGGVSAR